MRAMLWIAASGALLASGSARAGPGLPYAHDDVVYPDDVAQASDPRRVDVTITERGPQPSEIQVKGPEKVQLVVTRESTRACRWDLLIPELEVRTAAPDGQPIAITVLARGDGRLHLRCPAEDYASALDAGS